MGRGGVTADRPVQRVDVLPHFDAEFVWDDRAAIMSNEDVIGTTPWQSVFEHDFWGMDINAFTQKLPTTVRLSFRFDYARYGLEAGVSFFECHFERHHQCFLLRVHADRSVSDETHPSRACLRCTRPYRSGCGVSGTGRRRSMFVHDARLARVRQGGQA